MELNTFRGPINCWQFLRLIRLFDKWNLFSSSHAALQHAIKQNWKKNNSWNSWNIVPLVNCRCLIFIITILSSKQKNACHGRLSTWFWQKRQKCFRRLITELWRVSKFLMKLTRPCEKRKYIYRQLLNKNIDFHSFFSTINVATYLAMFLK